MDQNEKTFKYYVKQNEKLIQLVKKVKESDDNDAFDKIYKRMEKYIKSIISKFFISGLGDDDILQECLIALRFKAINDYDENKGPFIRFAKLCIRRHIITELKACKKKKYLALNSAFSL
ncbi:MAG: sigma factor, partial [bacterium]